MINKINNLNKIFSKILRIHRLKTEVIGINKITPMFKIHKLRMELIGINKMTPISLD